MARTPRPSPVPPTPALAAAPAGPVEGAAIQASPIIPSAPAPVAAKRGFPVLMHLHLDGDSFEPGAFAFVTEGAFDQLQRDQVFLPGLDWEDGAEPEAE